MSPQGDKTYTTDTGQYVYGIMTGLNLYPQV